jgi:uncharacterized protein HemX
MNGPRIGGIEPSEPTPVSSVPNTETPALTAEFPRENRNAVQKTGWWLALAVGLALVVASGAGVYAHRLQIRVVTLQTQLTQTRATAQAALEKVGALKIPKDLSIEVASLEVTANKLRAADEALRRSFNDEMQKIPAIDSRLSAAHSALATRQAETDRELKGFWEKSEERLTNIITVLKNQDKVLRQLVETPRGPENEE